MRNGQNKRMRGRNRGGGKGQNPLTRVYESNGPDVKIRGTASHIAEKYMQLARDSQASSDPVAAENYFQHAEHYFRLIAAAQEQFRQANPYYQQQQAPGQMQGAADVQEDYEDGEGEPIGQPGAGQGPGQGPGGEQPQFGTRDPQPYLPRDAQFFQPRDQQGGGRAQQPRNDGDVDRLPSFITGGGAQPSPQGQGGQGNQGGGGHPGYGANGYENGQAGGERGERGGERFHRRRRRHRGPRHDMAGQGAGDGGDDAPPRE